MQIQDEFREKRTSHGIKPDGTGRAGAHDIEVTRSKGIIQEGDNVSIGA